MLRGGVEEDDDEHNGGVDDDDVVDVSTALAMFELEGRGGDSEDADGRDEELITVDEDAEGLREGEEKGDKRKPRMGRDSTGLDRECSCS